MTNYRTTIFTKLAPLPCFFAALMTGCSGPSGTSEAEVEVGEVQSSVALGGILQPRRHTYLGTYRPSTSQWTLELQPPGKLTTPTSTTFVYGNPNDTPLVGDWNGDGMETPGVWRQSYWYLRNTADGGVADVSFIYGNPTDQPIVGDWDGNGTATPGVFRNGTFYLRNSNTSGVADLSFGFGSPGDIPLAGDWNGDGVDTVAVYHPANSTFYLTNNPAGSPVADVVMPLGDPGELPIVGDWDADGKMTVGVSVGNNRFLANDMALPVADLYANPVTALATDIPITGNWNPGGLPGYPLTPAPLSSFFPIGVWAQYASDFDKWRTRGINTVVGVPEYPLPPQYVAETKDNWTNAANCKGRSSCTKLKMIRDARPNPHDDDLESNLLAWMPIDEPELPNNGGLQAVQDRYSTLKKANPTRPIFFDLVGLYVYDPTDACGGPGDYTTSSLTCYPSYINSEDWISHDFYPLNFRELSGGSAFNTGDIRVVAKTMDRVKLWSWTKPQFVFVEASPKIYSGTSVGPTPDELRAEIWLAIIHGAKGITYFTYSVCNVGDQGWCPDGVTPSVAAEMTKQNARITSLASVIQSPINPSSVSFALGKSSINRPIEASWRVYGGKAYLFVLNSSPNTVSRVPMTIRGLPAGTTKLSVVGENRTVALSGAAAVDSFGPYQVHVYQSN